MLNEHKALCVPHLACSFLKYCRKRQYFSVGCKLRGAPEPRKTWTISRVHQYRNLHTVWVQVFCCVQTTAREQIPCSRVNSTGKHRPLRAPSAGQKRELLSRYDQAVCGAHRSSGHTQRCARNKASQQTPRLNLQFGAAGDTPPHGTSAHR